MRTATRIFNLYTKERCVVSCTLWPLNSGKKACDTNWTGDWVGLTTDLDAMAKRLIYALDGNQTPAFQPVA
jgi:hypothetical protein